ncbi:histidinol-phosphatase [Xinfangfangia sp. D13-10-4-6]|uniref:histidinol-phosphatase n=1 Tax=Pseudogemmobacter hezensis TaxID=2737662 RepID=UPI001551DC62|nr:histidinol-phosphatase [Pseudogemmobacter hezensis]NPD16754.1 histidinol-phosphatase [Pseudogemmobacter hezensis]
MPISDAKIGQSLAEMAEFARGIAQEAGEKGLEWFRKPVAIDLKEDQSPVTEADRAVEALLRKRLGAAFPDHAILGEEFGREGGADAPTWVVDPIDGTRSFITGWPIWGTLLALTSGGQAQLGVLHMPALGESWVASHGGGCRFFSATGGVTKAQTSGCQRLSEARFYTTSPDYFDAAEQVAYQAIRDASLVQRFGGDCYSYGLLASGHIDLVVESRLQPYDFMTLAPIIEEAGGVITDWQGRPLTLASGEQVIAAATHELHREALALLQG